jgi:hypothetical protein
MGTSQEDLSTFRVRAHSFLLTMRNVSTTVIEKIKTRILRSVFFFFENRVVYEIVWKNMVGPYRPQMKTQYGACALHAG